MMSRTTGLAIDEQAHLRQSIADILTTPIGTRVMRRTYGSQVPMLIDQPDNALTQIRITSAIASALMAWEPRLQLTGISIERDPTIKGKALVTMQGNHLSLTATRAKAISLTFATAGGLAT